MIVHYEPKEFQGFLCKESFSFKGRTNYIGAVTCKKCKLLIKRKGLK